MGCVSGNHHEHMLIMDILSNSYLKCLNDRNSSEFIFWNNCVYIMNYLKR